MQTDENLKAKSKRGIFSFSWAWCYGIMREGTYSFCIVPTMNMDEYGLKQVHSMR
ncbi:hypothetical protein HGO97_002045 [Faecalicatena sp. AGMB00832]|uniref:Uncharacterized protein n=1 Tax=Faecalicatena faecalis TaxID=2726362 RepID=A0ABS6CZ51_9FIRM|nr:MULTISPECIES: hypothetical protein [Faecalicatena]MBU3874592.1 hypothetical protein [Faecalicatena faecalis]MCI6464789.1 hypothetical protein [Faecalicatena sp.]MDY5620009.1 hypothetical protein [Lachnospiraceae bacterium]